MKDKNAREQINFLEHKIEIGDREALSLIPIEFDCPQCKHTTLGRKRMLRDYSDTSTSTWGFIKGEEVIYCYSCGKRFRNVNGYEEVKDE